MAAEDLAETDWGDLAWEDVIELMQKFCHHPAVIFASRACDLVRARLPDN